MAWRRICAKPLPESVMTNFTDAYVRYPAPMCFLTGVCIDMGDITAIVKPQNPTMIR